MPAHAHKRRRLDPEPHPGPDDVHAAFVSWAEGQGVSVHGVGPAALPERGMGLVATQQIKAGAQLLHVPPSAMIMPASVPDSLSPQAKLTGTLLNLSTKSDPSYCECKQTWPTAASFRDSLAWFDPSDRNLDHKHLFPTSLASTFDRLSRDLQADAAALDRKPDDPEFLYHWAIANTRSFSFKPTGRKDGIMVLCPLLDYMNHCDTDKGCKVQVSARGYSLVAQTAIDKGQEILATYGAHSNDKLIAHYGFRIDRSQDDSVSLDEILLPQSSSDQRAALQSVGYLGNYSLSTDTRDLCFRTQVAIRSLILTSNEWEYFMTSGEDIAEDKSDVVAEHCRRMIRAERPGMEHKLKRLEGVRDSGEGNPKVLSMVIDRWREILHVLKRYLGDDS